MQLVDLLMSMFSPSRILIMSIQIIVEKNLPLFLIFILHSPQGGVSWS